MQRQEITILLILLLAVVIYMAFRMIETHQSLKEFNKHKGEPFDEDLE